MNLKPPALALAAVALLFAAAAGARSGAALSLGWYDADAYCDDALAQNPGDPAPCRYDAREDWTGAMCGDGVDNDSDEATDCLDSDCAATTACAEGTRRAADCGNGADDDGDGMADCADLDCGGRAGCPLCGDGLCGRGESGACTLDCGNTTCGDGECSSPESQEGCPEDCGTPACVPTGSEVCGNAADEDCDGAAQACDGCQWYEFWCDDGSTCGDGACDAGENCALDCGSGGCTSSSDCPYGQTCTLYGNTGVCSGCTPGTIWNGSACVAPPEDCGNVIDDDGDGATDCADSNCLLDSRCLGEISCNDGADNDSDGATDCADSECAGNLECLDEADLESWYDGGCYNKMDDDGDVGIDCNDRDCDGEYYPSEFPAEHSWVDRTCDYPYGTKYDGVLKKNAALLCVDGKDNDDNGDTDCADAACKAALPIECNEELECADGIDNDADGFIDCYDDDCDGRRDCKNEINCGDGYDDDGDAFFDCEDGDCDGMPTAGPNGEGAHFPQENMLQFYVCEFGAPALISACEESWPCFNGVDDDGDGQIDQTFGNNDWECMGYLGPNSVQTCPR